ncbi:MULTISPECIES: diacylglycerol kinase [unclassified Streptomyces]|uniref:Diacylglycerol kinase n=1 Tax=Streptomyces evansiae TaxID=3075535 RepID=A0ABU2QVK5_9ACTN|nr:MULTISPECIES: diacylglycerol kinase [unclassified Streptomyces]MYQ56528.1 diacylglycerol kinase [Streptomyces sp. SID4926]MYR28670.1 diacylglycerol kinase [Streptomyces sp. SID4945]EFK98809.1 diacylglycerol kinase [Streptomyces sp. SPB78]MDT0407986.1 diacylglycerol kinase [Streptomyces sp. DSM 41979]SCD77165.1 diacylglycerol kinase [Streptomyces sp. DfronAA-171]
MTSEITLFVNPTAGRGRGAAAARPAARVLRDAGFRVRTVVGTDAEDAASRAKEAVAAGTAALVAVGGDGLLSLALGAVAGTRTPLGVIAVGSGNDFGRSLGLPVRAPAEAAAVIARALREDTHHAVDLGRVAGRWYGTVLATGFDSRVNDRGNRMRLPLGRFRYDLAILAELAAFRPTPYRLRLDDGPVREIEATLVAVGNSTSYGGGMRICADARLDDGLLDITVVGPCSRATLLKVFPRVYRGTHLTHPVVTSYRAGRVELDAAGLTGYADGEPLGPLPLTATAHPAALRLLAPPRKTARD